MEREKQERNEGGKEDISDTDRVEGFMEREREKDPLLSFLHLLTLYIKKSCS